MKLIEILENRKEALKVSEVAKMLGVSTQQIYKMAAAGTIPHSCSGLNQILSGRPGRVDQERDRAINPNAKSKG
jgi:excisionase family DNA binding protein